MEKSHRSEFLDKKELVDIVTRRLEGDIALSRLHSRRDLPPDPKIREAAADHYRTFVCDQIEHHVESAVRGSIEKRKAAVPGLKEDKNRMLAYWGGSLVPGCADYCLKGKNVSLRHSSICNLDCKFCYYDGQSFAEPLAPHHYSLGDSMIDIHALSAMLDNQNVEGRAFGWVYYEPLCEKEKIYPAMRLIADHNIYQYLYTNGTLVTEDTLRRLADAGLKEIRFNLAATDCSDAVIKKIGVARKYFEYVCIESPVFTQYFESFVNKRKAILDTGVTHIHLAELQMTAAAMMKDLWKDEGPVYRHKKAYVSPIKSRHLIYDIFDLAVSESWSGVTLHDCANDVKLFRGVAGKRFSTIEYTENSILLDDFFVDAIDRYELAGKVRKYATS